jgi:hypothetical protein
LLLESPVGFVTIDKKGVFVGIEEAIESKRHIYSAMTSSYAQFLVFERKYFQQLIDEFDLALAYFEFKKAEYNEFLLKVQQKYGSI